MNCCTNAWQVFSHTFEVTILLYVIRMNPQLHTHISCQAASILIHIFILTMAPDLQCGTLILQTGFLAIFTPEGRM